MGALAAAFPTVGLSLPLGRRYIQAATSPKDIVIVVDRSGSMKGLRMTIAKHTVATILDTLGENDSVNVIAVNAPPHARPPPPVPEESGPRPALRWPVLTVPGGTRSSETGAPSKGEPRRTRTGLHRL